MGILNPGREPERESNRVDPCKCDVCGSGRLVSDGSGDRVCPSCGSRHGYLHTNKRPGESNWRKKNSIHKPKRWMENLLMKKKNVHVKLACRIAQDFIQI